MSLDHHDLRAIAEHDQAVDRVKHFGSDNVCSVESDDSDSEDDSDSDGGDRRAAPRPADRFGSYAPLASAAILFSLAFLNSTTVVAAGGIEEFSRPPAHPFLLSLVAVGMALGLRLTATVVDPELERLALHAFLDALATARISHKEAYALLGMSAGQFSDMCAGKLHTPTVTRLLNLPWPFWQAYLPSLAYLLTRKKVRDLVSDQQRRAS